MAQNGFQSWNLLLTNSVRALYFLFTATKITKLLLGDGRGGVGGPSVSAAKGKSGP